MSDIPDAYLGSWTNWSEGAFWGATFTTDSRTGDLITAIVAVYTQAVLGHFFGLIKFFVFYFRSSPKAKHALFHQHQAILRNRGSGIPMLFDSLRLLIAWRGKGTHTIRRTLSFTFMAACFAAIIYGGTIGSARISSMPDLVLIEGDINDCGSFLSEDAYYSDGDFPFASQRNDAILAQVVAEGARSARKCYEGAVPSNSSSCTTYGRKLISWQRQEIDECPIGPGACEQGTSPISYDSGYIDTLQHLGINAPRGEKMFMKVTASCAPLNITDYVLTPRTRPNYTLTDQFYGPQTLTSVLQLGPMFWTDSFNTSQVTADESSLINFNETAVFAFWNQTGTVSPSLSPFRGSPSNYILDSQNWSVDNFTWTSGTFLPRRDIPWLNRSTMNKTFISLLILAQNNLFAEPVTDPLFRAQDKYEDTDSPRYQSEQQISALACTSNNFMCPRSEAGNDGCVPAPDNYTRSGLEDFLAKHGDEFDMTQKTMLKRLAKSLDIAAFFSISFQSRAQGLLANEVTYNGVSETLPNDQWIRELDYMFSTMMVSIQLNSFNWARNVLEMPIGKARPFDNETDFCQNQVIASAQYKSFSVAGICLIFICGFLVFVLDMTMPSIIKRLPPKSILKTYRLTDWDFHHFFQLERWAYESNGCGRWKGEDTAPIADPVEKFVTPLGIMHPELSEVDNSERGRFLRGADAKYSEQDSTEYKGASSAVHPVYRRGA